MTITGTSGNDTLTGTSGDDVFQVYQGGNDTLQGLAGNDIFNFGASFTAADSVDGGTGNDVVELKGDYSSYVTFGATTMVNVEKILVGAGFNYALATNDTTVAAGQTLTVDASALAAANTLGFDGSQETNGFFHVIGGAGADSFAMGTHLVAGDSLNGGAGSDSLFLGGDYNMVFTATTLLSIDDLVLFGGHSYHFTTNDATVAAGATMNVDANSLGASDTLFFNGAPETNGNFNFDAPAGQMTVTTGAGSDVFFMGGHLTAADRINGGAGSDVVFLGGNYNLTLAPNTLLNIENLKLLAGFSYHITSGGGIATNATMVIDATALTASDSATLNFKAETQGSIIFDGGAAPANITGGQQGDAFDFSVTNQGGLTASDHIDGQGAYDRLYLDGDYTGAHALVFQMGTVINVEEFDLQAGFSYDLTISGNTIASGGSLLVDASTLGATDHLAFNGAAANSAREMTVKDGAGDDTITTGAGSDTIYVDQGGNDTVNAGAGGDIIVFGDQLTASDSVNGGAGDDDVTIDGVYMGAGTLVLGATTLVSVENLILGSGNPSDCYDITTNDATVAAGQTLLIQGGNLDPGQTVRIDGSAETDGHFVFVSSPSADNFTGGALSDTFEYSAAVGGLTGAGRDTINAFNFANDIIAFAAVSTIDAALTKGFVNSNNIDNNLQAIVTAAHLDAHGAVLLTANSGDLAGHTFLIVDGNGTAGYQAGADLVIELQGALNPGAMSTANFIA